MPPCQIFTIPYLHIEPFATNGSAVEEKREERAKEKRKRKRKSNENARRGRDSMLEGGGLFTAYRCSGAVEFVVRWADRRSQAICIYLRVPDYAPFSWRAMRPDTYLSHRCFTLTSAEPPVFCSRYYVRIGYTLVPEVFSDDAIRDDNER